MNLVSQLDLPLTGCTAPGFAAGLHHGQPAEPRQPGWPARSPLACIVPGRGPGGAPGPAPGGEPVPGGAEGICGIGKAAVRRDS